MELLNSAFILNTLSNKDKKIIINALEPKTYEAGETVIEKGTEGDDLFVVDSGTLVCTQQEVRASK
jgi:cAMP-dependent protein kinase regulator